MQGRIPSTLQNSKATALTSARRASAAAQGCSCARSTGRLPCSSLQSYTSWQVGTQGSKWPTAAQKHTSKQSARATQLLEGMLTRTRKGAASAGSSARTAGPNTGSLLLSRHALMPGRDMSLREGDIDVPV